jgi:hypothetical protein
MRHSDSDEGGTLRIPRLTVDGFLFPVFRFVRPRNFNCAVSGRAATLKAAPTQRHWQTGIDLFFAENHPYTRNRTKRKSAVDKSNRGMVSLRNSLFGIEANGSNKLVTAGPSRFWPAAIQPDA